ncbi:MAG: nitroreductase [Clostridia bacterium]|jgi:nitroreductase|nr:nitroreductase [Clostridia bacterium]
MNIIDAIYGRRSIRKYKSDCVPQETINKLLDAATLAPSSSNSQPWSFVVIQDAELLKIYSDRAKILILNLMGDKPDPHGYRDVLSDPEFNIFYNAGTLIIIYSTFEKIQAIGDCSLAAQNIMLAAHAYELGTCWIGFSLSFFNTAVFKDELGIPQAYKAVAPLIVGFPEATSSNYSRKPPRVLAWK